MAHYYLIDEDTHLAHYGIKGQKKGIRRWQNYDGTYTQEGLERYWPGSNHGVRGGDGKQRDGLFAKKIDKKDPKPSKLGRSTGSIAYDEIRYTRTDENGEKHEYTTTRISDVKPGDELVSTTYRVRNAYGDAVQYKSVSVDKQKFHDDVLDAIGKSKNAKDADDMVRAFAEKDEIKKFAESVLPVYDATMNDARLAINDAVNGRLPWAAAMRIQDISIKRLSDTMVNGLMSSGFSDDKIFNEDRVFADGGKLNSATALLRAIDQINKPYLNKGNVDPHPDVRGGVSDDTEAVELNLSTRIKSLRGKAYDENGNVVDVNAYKKLINTRNDLREARGQEGNLRGMSQERLDVLKRKQERKINNMYDHEKKWTDRKIRILEKKGKQNKANVWKEANRQNEEARERQLEAVRNMKKPKDYRKSRALSFQDHFFGGQDAMDRNFPNMTTFPTRLQEYNNQRNMRWRSNFTFDKTLGRMTPAQGLEYLDRKARRKTAYGNGRASVTPVVYHSAYYVVDKDSDYGYHIF